MRYLYCVLPGGNAAEFAELEVETLSRGVALEHADLAAEGRIYRIPESDAHKLPSDERGPYFGDEDSGHGLTEPTEHEPVWLVRTGARFDWVKAKCPACNGHGMIGGFVSADSGYDGQACQLCSVKTLYRLVCRDNRPSISDALADVHKGPWVSTPQEAIRSIKERPIAWMRWSFALLVEDTNRCRMWVHSVPGSAEILDPPKEPA